MQPIPELGNAFCEETLPNVQPEPFLAQLEAISFCPVPSYLCSSSFSLVQIYPCVCKGFISVQGHRTLDLLSLTGNWKNYIWQHDYFLWNSMNASTLFKLCS